MKKIFLILAICLNLFSKDTFLFSCANAYVDVMNDNPNRAELENNAKAILIFPSVNKFGFIVGGMYGKGVFIDKENGDYVLTRASLSDASIGFQAGFENSKFVVFVMDRALVNSMKNSKVSLGANAGVLVGSAGLSAGTFDATSKELYVYTTKNGFFAGLSLGGVVLNADYNLKFSPSDFGYSTLLEVIRK